MKTLRLGARKKCRGNEASSINFRPSPNFKHMKKYLKSKFEEDMNSGMCAPEQIEQNNKIINQALQPPLPPNSPPPDNSLGVVVKQEVMDNEYENAESSGDDTKYQADDAAAAPAAATTATAAPAATNGTGTDRPVMCKDFVRGTCTRGAACIYAHKLDLMQLDGVYRFCRDFENKRCMRPVCYFVHATTFEKEHFMRSGTLPPHTTAHLRTLASAAPPPPPLPQPQPPAPTHQADLAGDHSPMFANAPAATLASNAGGGGATACAGAGALEARLPLDALPALPTVASVPAPLKRDWREHHPFSSPPRDLEASEPLAKKCKRCDLTELRLQHSKAQVASMLRASQELDDQLDKVVSSNNRLHAILKMLLKPRMMTKILLGSDSLPAENGRDLAT